MRNFMKLASLMVITLTILSACALLPKSVPEAVTKTPSGIEDPLQPSATSFQPSQALIFVAPGVPQSIRNGIKQVDQVAIGEEQTESGLVIKNTA